MEESADPFPWFLLSILKPFSFESAIELVLMVILLLCSALVSGSEVAFFSLSPQDLKDLKDEKDRRAKLIQKLLEKPKKLLATILIGNNFVNVAIIILSSLIIENTFDFSNAPLIGFIFQVVIVTFLILLMGEVIPKVYANKNSIQLLKVMAIPMGLMFRIFAPLSLLLTSFTRVIDKRITKKSNSISVDELSHALELTSDETVADDEQKILEGIVKFGNTAVKQVMCSRVDVVAFEYNTPLNEVVDTVLKSGFSRIPVFKENFDHIVGIIYIKDLLPHLDKKPEFKWQELIRPAFFVPENKKIDDLLKEFQERKIHLAVVVDEYGGSSGVISLEDIIEEIVGEISDEFDDVDIVYSKLDDTNYVFRGKTPLKDFYRIVGIEGTEFEEAKGDSDTLAGFILEIHGMIPKKNETIRFNNYAFNIEAADKRKISAIKVTIHPVDKKTEEKFEE